MTEQACEPIGNCDTDQLSFKAYFSAWLAQTIILAPFTTDAIIPLLEKSATAAALQCSGGASGEVCGFKWTDGATWDGSTGVGQQMSALGAIQSAMITIPTIHSSQVVIPVTNTTGGTSIGNPAAGSSSLANPAGDVEATKVVTTGDRVAAGFLTVAVLGGVIGGSTFMILGS